MAACVFNAVSVGGWTSLDMISAELYPTSVSMRAPILMIARTRQ